MYYLLSILCGSLIAIMIAINGNLTGFFGTYTATVIIHFLGLIFVAILLLIKKEKFLPRAKLPLYYYLGGVLGVATTAFNNLAFMTLSVSAILALGLLGQSITSIIVDHLGAFQTSKQPFEKKKLIGFAFVVIGTAIILSI